MTARDILTLCEEYASMSPTAERTIDLLRYTNPEDVFLERYARLAPVDQHAVTDWLDLATSYGLDATRDLLRIAREHNKAHPHPGRVAWYSLSLEELDAQRRSAS